MTTTTIPVERQRTGLPGARHTVDTVFAVLVMLVLSTWCAVTAYRPRLAR